MLFNSYIFLFAFLPIALVGYQLAARWHRRAVVLWLAFISLAFYAYWRPAFLILLCASILFNYVAGALISRRIANNVNTQIILIFAIAINLGTLCYFKYLFPLLNFIAGQTHSVHRWSDVVLPLGISFFTFTQIAYLVDLQQGGAVQQDLGSYTLFATFFPHLIAGPILHHSEIMPQFQQDRDYRLRLDDVCVGFTWFVMGLCKKVLLADRFAPGADSAFVNASQIATKSAWAGVLSYSLQLYFDFSGYSDMANGLARMFSIDFPLNFASPYKSASIIDFWQRWHMTLTRYINVYLYNPIALWVSRQRAQRGMKISRKAMGTPSGFTMMIGLPTLVSLFLAGVWHGAGMQFILFGLLHALYLTVNHAFRVMRTGKPRPERSGVAAAAQRMGSVLLTYAAVLLAQIFFRAASVAAAFSILGGLLGLHRGSAVSLDTRAVNPLTGAFLPIALAFFIVWAMPNTQQILARFKPSLELAPSDREPGRFHWLWLPTPAWGLALGALFLAVLIKMENPTTFLYFQF